jgi:hypothetical protein
VGTAERLEPQIKKVVAGHHVPAQITQIGRLRRESDFAKATSDKRPDGI